MNNHVVRGDVQATVMLAIAIALMFSSYHASAQWVEESTLLPAEVSTRELLASSVAVSGDVAVVSAILFPFDGNMKGGTFVYRYEGASDSWVEEQQISASDGEPGDLFSSGVAVSDNVIVVGAERDGPGSAYVFRFNGSSWVEEQKLTSSDGSNGDAFGFRVAVSGDVAIVGAYLDNDAGRASGAAYIYRYDGTEWFEEQKLTASDAATWDVFGVCVGIAGGLAVVGAMRDDDNGSDSGAAYVYRYDGTTWIEEKKITASDGASDDEFGSSVAVFGDVVAVGAHGVDSDTGAAYVYRYDGTTWIEEYVLTGSARESGDAFGDMVSVSGDSIIVGASNHSDTAILAGAGYVFRYNGTTWVEERKLVASNATAGASLGFSAGISGDSVIIGAPYAYIDGVQTGAAYMYRFTGPLAHTEQQKLLATGGATSEQFGAAVSTWGDLMLVGSPFDGDNGDFSGSAFVYRYDGTMWIEEQKLLASDGEASDWFGRSVSVSGDLAVVGNENEAVYVFRYDGTVWVEEQVLTVVDNLVTNLFGKAVSVSGDVILVGDTRANDNGSDSGAAYIFRYDGVTWIQEKRVVASDGNFQQNFGFDVSSSGDCAVVTSFGNENSGGTIPGAAYVIRFDGSSWVEEQKLILSESSAFDSFGFSADIYGDVIVVGASGDNELGEFAGAAYVWRFDGNSWNLEQKLTATDGQADSRFGVSVAIDGDLVVLGTLRDAQAGDQSGAAYLFRYNGKRWYEEDKVLASDGHERDRFGAAVSISGDVVAVGAPGDSALDIFAGAAYVFRGTGYEPASPHADADGPYLVECEAATPEGTHVQLDGTGSFDPDCDAITFSWTVSRGTIDNDASERPLLALPGLATGTVVDISLNVSDGTSSDTVVTTATLVDTTPPVIELVGSPVVYMACSAEGYTELGASANDSCDGTVDVVIGGDVVDESTPGVYIVTYDATDGSSNVAAQVIRTVILGDPMPPVIELVGPPTVYLECGVDTYSELGASASDACDGTVDVVIGGDVVDESKPGVYSVSYTATGASTHVAIEVVRMVTVQDTTAPELTLVGDDPMELMLGATFVEPGYSAADSCDGDITNDVVVRGATAMSTIGSYALKYTVRDASGNEARAIRIVNVIARPVDMNEDGMTNAVDIQILINIILGILSGDADLNNDGVTNSADIQFVINVVLGT